MAVCRACKGIATQVKVSMHACVRQDAKALLLDRWVAVAESLRDCSSALRPFPHLSGPALHFLFADREASTLSKHLSAWLRWCEFAKAIQTNPGKPTPAAVLDFAQALSLGARVDRGCKSAARAQGVLQALKFVSSKLGLLELMEGVSCPAVAAWVASGKWEQAPPREAVPPLFVVAKLEMALKDSAEDAWLLGAILLMVWGGLRWSDVQRLQFSSLVIDDKSIRGWCWCTKSSKHGMPFGIQTCGVTPAMRGQRYGVMSAECTKAMPERDFLLSRQGLPLGYAMMLAQFRRCLALYGGVPPDRVGGFSLHRCKATSLSWAHQVWHKMKSRSCLAIPGHGSPSSALCGARRRGPSISRFGLGDSLRPRGGAGPKLQNSK